MTSFAGKTVVVTGAGSGIGRLMAQKIAARGGRVILWDISETGLDQTRDLISGVEYPPVCFTCDVTNREMIRDTADAILRDIGPVDILINNAGIVSGKPLLELSDEAIQRTFEVNTLSLFWTTRAFLPGMIAKANGHVVTIASAGGLIGVPRMTDYSASKFAAVGFDESLRVELKRLGHTDIRTTVICPFFISTGMFAGVKTRFSWLLPIMKPEEVAETVVRAVEKNRGRVIMPSFAYVLYPARLLPTNLFDHVVTFFGINNTMDDFQGRGHG